MGGLMVEFLRALALGGVPVCAASFLLAWWGLRRGMFKELGSVDALGREVKSLSKLKPAERTARNPMHDKWLKFGGGFYGVVGLLTWIKIEIEDLPTQVPDLLGGLFRLDIGVVVQFFVDSLMNFVAAISWPAYWLQRIHSPHPWAWFIAAWLGYWAGVRLAQAAHARSAGTGG